MNTLLRTTIFTAALPAILAAQSVMSPAQPMGMPLDPSLGTSVLMAGTGTGIASDRDVMSRNVANLGAVNRTLFGINFNTTILRVSENDTHTDHIRTMPRQISFAFPLGDIATAAVSYAKQSDISTRHLGGIDAEYKRMSSEADGGLSALTAGFGRKIGRTFNVGLSIGRDNFKSNSWRRTDQLRHPDSTTSTDTALTGTETILSKVSYRGGRITTGLIASRHGFSGGVQVGIPFAGTLAIDRTVRDTLYATQTGFAGIGSYTGETKYTLPPALRLGLAYTFSPRLTIAADGAMELWKSWGDVTAQKKLTNEELGNSRSLSAGFRFVPAPDLLMPRYWETIEWCAGTRVALLPDQATREFSLSLGTGLPIRGLGNINLGLEGGQRTNSKFGDVREHYINLSIGLIGGRPASSSSDNTY